MQHMKQPSSAPLLKDVEETESEQAPPVQPPEKAETSMPMARSQELGSPSKCSPSLTHKRSMTPRPIKKEEKILPGMIPMSLDEARTHTTTVHDMLLSKLAAFVGQLHIFENVVLAAAFQSLVDIAHDCVTNGHNLSALVHSISSLSKAIWVPPEAFGHLKEAQTNLDKLLAQFASIQNLGSDHYVPMKGSSRDHRRMLTELASSMIDAANVCLVAVFSVLDIAPPSTIVQVWRPLGMRTPLESASKSTLQDSVHLSEKRVSSTHLSVPSEDSSLRLPNFDTVSVHEAGQHERPSSSGLGLCRMWVPPSVHTDVEPFGDGLIARSKDGRILGGNMMGLLSAMCRESIPSYSAHVLLQTFRVYCTPEEFLTLILSEFDKSVSTTGRRSLFRLMYTWVSQHWYAPVDFQILSRLMEFAQQPACKAVQPSMESLSSICAYRLRQQDEEFPTDPHHPLSLPVYEGKKMGSLISHRLVTVLQQTKVVYDIDVLAFDPAELARQITLRESKLFSQITIHEFLNRNSDYKGTSYHSKSIHVKEMSLLSTQLTNWLGECILREKDLKRRTQKLLFFILLALEGLELGNYNLVMAILGGLNSSTITRLKSTWAGIPTRKKAKLEKLCKVFDNSRNFRTYRTRLRETQGPAVPFLGLILTDITFCCNGNSVMRTFSSCTEPLINFARCYLLSNIVQDMKRFQRVYPIEPIPEVQDFLQRMQEQGNDCSPNDYTEAMESMYQRSLELEPRDATPDALPSVRKGNVMSRTISAFLNTHSSHISDDKGSVTISRTSMSPGPR